MFYGRFSFISLENYDLHRARQLDSRFAIFVYMKTKEMWYIFDGNLNIRQCSQNSLYLILKFKKKAQKGSFKAIEKLIH